MQQPHGRDLRKGRVSEAGRIYHITTVTHQRIPYFSELNPARLLTQTLMAEQHHATTLCYVIMPDHLHWLIELTDSATLEKCIKTVKAVSAHKINKHLQRTGPIWQAGYYNHALRQDEDIIDIARYIIANPLRKGLVESIREYPHWDAIWIP